MARRILSLWFPRLAAERALRRRGAAPGEVPFAIVGDRARALVLTSLSPEAEAAGLSLGQPLRDATAMCPHLVTEAADPAGEAAFLTRLRRWAGKFSPWVAEAPPDALMVDLTGCAHLFGGEAALLRQVAEDCAALGLTVRAGIADTPGAAWALARFARAAAQGQGQAQVAGPGAAQRSGDDIVQEARATRSRAARRRHWERGGPLPLVRGDAAAGPDGAEGGAIAPPGGTRAALAPLPLPALRLPAEAVEGLVRLGLHRVGDLMALPRAGLARRFGAEVVRRLDQALGIEPEPVSPAAAPLHFATRLTFPDPIGRPEDIAAAVDRLLPPLCERLAARGHGARRLRLQAFRADGSQVAVEVALAHPARHPDRMRPLLALKYDSIDPGFGIDCLRLEAVASEPLSAVQHRGPLEAPAAVATSAALPARASATEALADLIGKLGARLGPEAVTRLHPAESHLPEKAAIALTAAWSAPWPDPWPRPSAPRPMVLFAPEALHDVPEGDPMPPARFRWRRRDLVTRMATGPERILPEWWFDLPEWRSGARDYWRVETEGGERLWLFFAHGAAAGGGWFCHGRF